MQTLSTTIFAAWHHDGPGWWIVFVPLFWIVVIGGIVLLLRSRGGCGTAACPQPARNRARRARCSLRARRDRRRRIPQAPLGAHRPRRRVARLIAAGGAQEPGARATTSTPAPIGTSDDTTRVSASTRARKSATWSAWEMTLSTTSRPGCASTRTRSGPVAGVGGALGVEEDEVEGCPPRTPRAPPRRRPCAGRRGRTARRVRGSGRRAPCARPAAPGSRPSRRQPAPRRPATASSSRWTCRSPARDARPSRAPAHRAARRSRARRCATGPGDRPARRHARGRSRRARRPAPGARPSRRQRVGGVERRPVGRVAQQRLADALAEDARPRRARRRAPSTRRSSPLRLRYWARSPPGPRSSSKWRPEAVSSVSPARPRTLCVTSGSKAQRDVLALGMRPCPPASRCAGRASTAASPGARPASRRAAGRRPPSRGGGEW